MAIKIIIGLCLVLGMPTLAFSTTYPLPKPGNDIVGEVFVVRAQPGDTIGTVGLRYEMSLHEMMEANPGMKEGRKLRAGQKLIVPGQHILPTIRQGIVINMPELRLYYFPPGGKYVMTYPVAMGRDQWRTPTLTTKVIYKERDPVWHVPDSIRAWTFENSGKWLPDEVPPGPDNPLGHYALHLGENGYLIHGNNAPNSIGKYVSSGCIRMKNADIEVLYNLVNVGTPVYIIHHPNKVGWFNGELYLESQIPVAAVEDSSNSSLEDTINQSIQNRAATINWQAAERIFRQHRGIPGAIGQAEGKTNTAYENHPPLPIQLGQDSSSDDNADITNSDEANYSWVNDQGR